MRRVVAGLTLVELLVVIGIVVVLLAVLVPALDRAIIAAQKAKCASNESQLHKGVLSVAADNVGVVLPCSGGSVQLALTGWVPEGHFNSGDENGDSAGAAAIGRMPLRTRPYHVRNRQAHPRRRRAQWLEPVIVPDGEPLNDPRADGEDNAAMLLAERGLVKVSPASLTSDVLQCPSRDFTAYWSRNRLWIGYQYFGGMPYWFNASEDEGLEARSPMRVTTGRSDWVLAADATIRVDGQWGYEGNMAMYKDAPSHKTYRNGSTVPEGHNQLYMDGSAIWVNADQFVYIHHWFGSGEVEAFWNQKDLGEWNPTPQALYDGQ